MKLALHIRQSRIFVWGLFRELDQDFNCVKQWLDQAQAEQLTSNKLKSLKVAKWRKDDEGWIKNDEGWMKNDEGWMKNDEGWMMYDDDF